MEQTNFFKWERFVTFHGYACIKISDSVNLLSDVYKRQIDNCVTRLRLEVKDITAVNDKVIKSAGVAGVIKPGKTSVQVIIGTKVQFVADEFTKLCE